MNLHSVKTKKNNVGHENLKVIVVCFIIICTASSLCPISHRYSTPSYQDATLIPGRRSKHPLVWDDSAVGPRNSRAE